MNLVTMRSDSPFKYILRMSIVLTPRSQAVCNAFSIYDPARRVFWELYHVLCQRSSLVGEYIFGLSEIIRTTPVLWDTCGIEGLVVHVQVLSGEVSLDGLDALDGDKQGDRDNVLKGDETRPEGISASIQVTLQGHAK